MDYNAFKRPFSMYQFLLVVCSSSVFYGMVVCGQRERVMNRVANHPFAIMCLPNVNVIKNIITAEPIATISSTRRSFCCLLTVLMCSRWLQIMSIKAAQANKHIAITRITILNLQTLGTFVCGVKKTMMVVMK